MADRKNLVALGPDTHAADADRAPESAEIASEAATPSEEYLVVDDEWIEDEPVRRPGRFGWVVPALAVLAALGWTGFFGWVHQSAILAGASPAQWSEWIVAWAVPV